MRKVDISFDRYYTYAELTDFLQACSRQYPGSMTIESIGQSYEGRDVWAATLTNWATGQPEDKPAMYVDGNIHAGEVTSSMACLHLIDYLLTNYEQNEHVRKLLDNRTFYILPRVNPDGAELYLSSPTSLRSSVRVYPEYRKDEDPPGLHAEDFDGNGEILLMRIRDDERGSWKPDSEDPRLLVERSPWDLQGPFYHVYTEGVLRDHSGNLLPKAELPFVMVPTKYGLDLNRNFPAGYSPLTPTSGPYPLSEPETRNQVEFISKHPNIAGVLLYHTTGGVLFRPHSTIPDRDFPREDLVLFEALGQMGTEVTGYPPVCCYGEVFSGVLDDWCFEHLGLFAFTPELWDAIGRAAPELKGDPMKPLGAAERRKLELKLLQWNDREFAGRGFVAWHEADHPQFGKVEIGGWRVKQYRQNPPPNFLEAECHKINQFALAYALALPEVHIDTVEVEKISTGVYSVQALVSNHGFLPTNISKQAIKTRRVRPDFVKVEFPPEATLVNCEPRYSVGHMEGYAAGQQMWFSFYGAPAASCRRVKWTIKTDGTPCEVAIKLISQRGGKTSRIITLS